MNKYFHINFNTCQRSNNSLWFEQLHVSSEREKTNEKSKKAATVCHHFLI